MINSEYCRLFRIVNTIFQFTDSEKEGNYQPRAELFGFSNEFFGMINKISLVISLEHKILYLL